MRSFGVPYTDDQIDVDTEHGLVKIYRNAWNRESSGTPDETYSYAALRSDSELRKTLTSMLADSDAADLERLIMTEADVG